MITAVSMCLVLVAWSYLVWRTLQYINHRERYRWNQYIEKKQKEEREETKKKYNLKDAA
jgi:hypothetical protein